ncbi:hypothetical protein MNBD_PLANCTO03-1348 [hydrothermal vent metagenome]|uniref:CobQ/CobB/MinD/ParA nucleotide binding domain-containing protein n=1 Tax=hydrothermal vent metagenome TaxID=652676 RepID=A0A3B1DCC5_9ZZZZ
MSHDITHAEDWHSDSEPESEAPAVNPLLVVHRCLRGRYLLAILLAVALAVPSAILGYIALPPKFTSSGQVNIAPTRSYIMYQNELNEPLSAYNSFLQSQASMLQSYRVVDMAVNSDKLKEAGWAPAPQGTVDLMQSLKVSAPSRGQDIFISVEHPEPAKAQAAVNAILDAYSDIAIDKEEQTLTATLKELRELKKKYAAESERARQEAFRVAELEGTDDLQARRDAKHQHWARLDTLIDEYTLELVRFGDLGLDTPDDEAAETIPITDVTPEMLAQTDAELARLLNQREQVELEFASLQRRYAEKHRAVISAKHDLETIEAMIEARTALLAGGTTLENGSPAMSAPAVNAMYLRAQLETLKQLRNTTKEEARRLGTLQLQIEKYRDQAARTDEQYDLADARLNALEVENRHGSIGRISITQRGFYPIQASTDRRIPLATIGALGGTGIGIGLVAAIGFFFPKYRYIGDLNEATRNVFVIGAVPELDPADPESRELVAASIHQVRSVIDARLLGTSDRASVHVVTSAGASEGKSTIALRLAKSFAATGRRTLLIDSDMIGRRLSNEFAMLDVPGFADAVTAAGEAGQTVHDTPIRDLYLMPCGRTDRVEPEEISAKRAGDLLGPLQEVFQAIVVDTGPILGSLEAQALAPIADEVMLVVTRGREVRSVKLAIDRLHQLGTRKIGVIFNRATRHDIERSTSISVTSQRHTDVHAHWHEQIDPRPTNGQSPTARLESATDYEN